MDIVYNEIYLQIPRKKVCAVYKIFIDFCQMSHLNGNSYSVRWTQFMDITVPVKKEDFGTDKVKRFKTGQVYISENS